MSTNEKTYLNKLYKCIKKAFPFIKNQIVFYVLFIELPVKNDNYNSQEADFIIDEEIKIIKEVLKNGGISSTDGRKLIRKVLRQIIGQELRVLPRSKKGMLKCFAAVSSERRIEINKKINGKNKLLKEWYNETKKNDGMQRITTHIFWLLQYAFSIIGSEDCIYKIHYDNENEYSEYKEYYCLMDKTKELLFRTIKEELDDIPTLKEMTWDMINTLALARMITECAVMQMESNDQEKALEILKAENRSVVRKKDNVLDEYNKKVAIYDKTTIDWFHVCRKYAVKNYVAATELANVFFAGAVFQAGEISRYEISQDFSKAVELYKKAIEMSDPPYAPACWNMGILLIDNFYKYTDDAFINNTAKEYLIKCGEYAPAYNSLAKIEIKENYIAFRNSTNMQQAEVYIDNITNALKKCYKASELGWLYGNNIIAEFLLQMRSKENGDYLVSRIKERWDREIELDPILFLQRSEEYDNPWSIYKLGLEYIKCGKMEEAEVTLKKAYDLKFYLVYHVYAKFFLDEPEKESVIKEAANHGCAEATYMLAKDYSKTEKEKRFLLDKAYNQVMMMRVQDISLRQKIYSEIRKMNGIDEKQV